LPLELALLLPDPMLFWPCDVDPLFAPMLPELEPLCCDAVPD
jgi:hypothetical protein